MSISHPPQKDLSDDEVEEDVKPVDVTLTTGFFIADREVSIRQFKQFADDEGLPSADKPENWQSDGNSASDARPIATATWYDAVLFCNWLSHREGRKPAYEFVRRLQTAFGVLDVLPPLVGIGCHEALVCRETHKVQAEREGIPTIRVNTGRWGTSKNFDELMANKGIEPRLADHTDDEGFAWVIEPAAW